MIEYECILFGLLYTAVMIAGGMAGAYGGIWLYKFISRRRSR